MNQLPMKFKLFLEGKFKGFLEYIPKNEVPWLESGESLLFPFFYFKPEENPELIRQSFDEMRQSTDYQDKNGEEIYFGDKLSNGIHIHTVQLSDEKSGENREIVAYEDGGNRFLVKLGMDFKFMELVK